YSVNPEGLIKQQREIKGTFFAFMARLPSHFPHMTARYVDLIVFAKVFFPAQFANFESANPGLPADLVYLATGASGSPPMRPASTPVIQPATSPVRTRPTVPAYMRPSSSPSPAQPAAPQSATPSPITLPAATSSQSPQSPSQSTPAAAPPPAGFASAPQVSFFTLKGTSKTPFRQAKLTKNLAGDLGAIDKSL